MASQRPRVGVGLPRVRLPPGWTAGPRLGLFSQDSGSGSPPAGPANVPCSFHIACGQGLAWVGLPDVSQQVYFFVYRIFLNLGGSAGKVLWGGRESQTAGFGLRASHEGGAQLLETDAAPTSLLPSWGHGPLSPSPGTPWGPAACSAASAPSHEEKVRRRSPQSGSGLSARMTRRLLSVPVGSVPGPVHEKSQRPIAAQHPWEGPPCH